MIPRLRSFVFVFSSIGLSLLLAACSPSPTIHLSAAPGETPGIIGPPPSSASKITVQSVNGFSGYVTFSTNCCWDVIRQRWVSPPTSNWAPYFSKGPSASGIVPQLSVPANGSDFITLNLSLLNFFPFGKFNVEVRADAAGGISRGTWVGIKKLLTTENPPSCSSATPLLRLATALNAQITAKENDPGNKQIPLAVYHPSYPSPPPLLGCQTCDVWLWTITDDPSIAPGEALVVLENRVPSGWEKEITTVGCSTKGKTVRVQGGKDGQITIKKAEDTTLIFRKPTGIFGSGGWVNVVVFAAPAFWSVFEGKKMTFRWWAD